MKKKFKVEVCRTSYSFNEIEVEAETPEEAKELALEVAGNYTYSESNAEYTTDGVTEKETSSPILLTEDEFKSKFTMIKSHLNKDRVILDGCLFETYGREIKYVASMKKTNRVWTLLEDNNVLYFQTGMCENIFSPISQNHIVGYFITEQPYTKQTVVRLSWH